MSFERSTLKSFFVDVNLSLLFSLRHGRSGIPSFTTVRCIPSCDPVAKFSYVLVKQCHCEFFHDSWCKNILFLLRLTCLHYTSVSIDNCAQVRFKPMTGIWECMECYIHRIIVGRGDKTNSNNYDRIEVSFCFGRQFRNTALLTGSWIQWCSLLCKLSRLRNSLTIREKNTFDVRFAVS